jgi:hypothetical protein
MAAPAGAQTPLFPAGVSQANLDCLFGLGAQCTVTPSIQITEIPLPGISGRAILHSHVVPAKDGSRADGRTLYQYQVDLTDAVTLVDSSCITNLTVKFGPVSKLPYAPGPVLRDVYEIQQNIPATQIGFASAIQTGDFVTFTFAAPVCASGGTGPGAISRSFGLASVDGPARGVQVQLDSPGLDDIRAKAFGPRR